MVLTRQVLERFLASALRYLRLILLGYGRGHLHGGS